MFLNRRRRMGDPGTDFRRLRAIKRSVTAAIAGIDADVAKLTLRVEEVRMRTGLLLGCETTGSALREPETERTLLKAELELVTQAKRLTTLRQLRVLLADTECRLGLLTAGLAARSPHTQAQAHARNLWAGDVTSL